MLSRTDDSIMVPEKETHWHGEPRLCGVGATSKTREKRGEERWRVCNCAHEQRIHLHMSKPIQYAVQPRQNGVYACVQRS